MKMAILEGYLYMKEVKSSEWVSMQELPARYDKKNQYFIARANIDVLGRLRNKTKLSEKVEQYYQTMVKVQELIDVQRMTEHPEPLVDYPTKYQLYDHQTRGANMALLQFGFVNETRDFVDTMGQGRGFGFLFEMGCGKTLTTIAVLGTGWKQGNIRKVLVVAPSSVCSVWTKEFEEYANFPFMVNVLVGSKEKRKKILKELEVFPSEALKVAVVNYESVWRLVEEIKQFQPEAIVCDESQRIKSHNTSQSKAMHLLGKMAKYKLILSGTPVLNSPLDIFSQFQFLDSNIFGENFFAFRGRYARMGGYGMHQIVSYVKLDELIEKTHRIAYRVTKEEALDLPEQTFETRYTSFSPEEKKLYEKMRRDSLAELEENVTVTATTILTKMLRLQQITGGFAKADQENKVRQVGTGKLQALEDILIDYVLEAGKKLVVFARFIPEVEGIRALLNKKSIPYAAIWGDIKMEERGEEVRRFQEEEDVKVFVAQIQTAGLGITLTAADTTVYYSKDFSYANYAQSLARTHRIGQKNACTYISLVVPGTIDEVVMKALEKKEDIANNIVDHWKEYFL